MAFNFKNKNTVITIVIILAIALLVYYVKFMQNSNSNPAVSEDVAICIGQNSLVYSQIGCHACEAQKELFGNYYKHINDFSCNSDWKTCTGAGVEATPTWLIKGKLYQGVQSIESLRALTGC